MIQTRFDNDLQRADLQRDGNYLTDSGLETAVVLSLFTDRQADEGDEIPDGSEVRRGFWADKYLEAEGDKSGSRLWLLDRSKTTQDPANLAIQYAKEALQWMIDDGLAGSIEVTGEIYSEDTIALAVEITRPGEIAPRWSGSWEILF